MAKLLLCEDNIQFAKTLLQSLASMRHAVDHVTTIRDAIDLVRAFAFDLLILDWELPDRPGIGACEEFKQIAPDMPILMLTGRATTGDAVIGLDHGADDYVFKPCVEEELSARIRSLLRRRDADVETISHGLLKIDPVAHSAYYDGTLLDLSPNELRLLSFLAEHPNKAFSIEALLARVWKDNPGVSRDLVRVYVSRLRKKLEQAGASDLLITHPGEGYLLVG